MAVSLPEKLLALHGALTEAALAHAFGGALALAWCTQQARGTIDIDVNVFVPVDQLDDLLAALPTPIDVTDADALLLRRDGQARLWWDTTPVDVFLNTTGFHDEASRPDPLGALRRRVAPVPGLPRPGRVQGVLQPDQGLGRPRGDARRRGPRQACRHRGARHPPRPR